MTIDQNSLAAVNGVSVKNEQFAVGASVIPQKLIIIGSYDEATFTGLAANVPFRVFSPEDAGSKTGFGFMLHRLVKYAMKPGIVETWVVPQPEGGSDPDQATGELDFSASAGVEAGFIYLYIAGELVRTSVNAGDTGIVIAGNVTDDINDNDDLPVTAVDNLDGTITITSKSGGTWGNDIDLSIGNENNPDTVSLPTGVACTITGMAGGAGLPDIQDALDAIGTGDGQNDNFFTVLVHGYGDDTATLDAISTYNGLGNGFVGNYKKEIARPFRSVIGDTTAQTAGLTAALAFAELRRETDRTNGKFCVPGSQNHPQEIAAQVAGVMAVTNSTRAEESYIDKRLDGIWGGSIADRWTNDYDNRDAAVRGGVGTSLVKNNVVYIQNVITFYRPESVAQSSNGYRSMRNISILQNLLANFKANFEREKWDGISIVEDVTEVSNVTDRLKARDVDAVIDDLVALAVSFAGNAWLYNSSYTIGELQAGDKVTLRAGLTGFDITFPVILSGEGGIFNSIITFDTSIAILTAGGN